MASTTWLWMGIGIVIAVFANLVVFAGTLPILEQTPLLIGKDSVIVVGLLTMVLLLVLGFYLIYRGLMARSGAGVPSQPRPTMFLVLSTLSLGLSWRRISVGRYCR